MAASEAACVRGGAAALRPAALSALSAATVAGTGDARAALTASSSLIISRRVGAFSDCSSNCCQQTKGPAVSVIPL